MINYKLVRNYTVALFESAINIALKRRVFEQIIIIQQLIIDNPQIKSIMVSPIVKDEEKLEIINLIEKNLDVEIIVKNFLLVLLKHSRMQIFSYVVVLYQQMLNNSQNIKMVKVISSKILQLEEKEWMEKYLEEDLGQKVFIEYIQNQTIIGGLVIQYDSLVRDYSIAGRLRTIATNLKSVKID